MADALVGRRPPARFFCHRCNIEFEDVLQDYICPYCASGFIEQLENESEGSIQSSDVSDADMSNLDDSDEMHQSASQPMLNDLAFLMSGGRLRGTARPETFLEQLVWTIGGGAATGAITAGAPFVLVGAPGDYVFGGEGLDAVVTQLLGQLENAGPPPLPRERIAAIPSEDVTSDHAAKNTSCSVCWENFQQGEKISRLECDHIFHSSCIEPWLNLHATCPICRRSLLPEEPAAAEAAPAPPPPAADAVPPSTMVAAASSESSLPSPSSSGSSCSLNIAPLLDEVQALATRVDTAAAAVSRSRRLRRADTAAAAAAVSRSLRLQRADTTAAAALGSVPRVLLRRLPASVRRAVSGLATQTWTAPDSGGSSTSMMSTGSWAPRSDTTNSNSSLNTNDRDRTQSYNMDIDFD